MSAIVRQFYPRQVGYGALKKAQLRDHLNSNKSKQEGVVVTTLYRSTSGCDIKLIFSCEQDFCIHIYVLSKLYICQ